MSVINLVYLSLIEPRFRKYFFSKRRRILRDERLTKKVSKTNEESSLIFAANGVHKLVNCREDSTLLAMLIFIPPSRRRKGRLDLAAQATDPHSEDICRSTPREVPPHAHFSQ